MHTQNYTIVCSHCNKISRGIPGDKFWVYGRGPAWGDANCHHCGARNRADMDSTIYNQYIQMIKHVKNAKDNNSRNFWLLNDRAADFYIKYLKDTPDESKAALERISIL